VTHELHVWSYGDCDFVVAADRDDAESALVASTGIGADELGDWEQRDDADELSISFANGVVSREAMCEPSNPGAVKVRRTFGEWVREFGAGYLCTTEF
jgi:hypothetical protein